MKDRYILHHIGIVIPDPERAERFCEKFGFEIDYQEYVEAYQADCIFLKHADNETPIELVVPKAGVLLDYNKGKGGLHHIAFAVDDVEAVKKEFEEKGMEMLEEKSVPGAGGIQVNFLRPRYGEGILTEYVQKT